MDGQKKGNKNLGKFLSVHQTSCLSCSGDSNGRGLSVCRQSDVYGLSCLAVKSLLSLLTTYEVSPEEGDSVCHKVPTMMNPLCFHIEKTLREEV